MTDGTEQINAYADHGCPKAKDGIHIWAEADENNAVACKKCGLVKPT